MADFDDLQASWDETEGVDDLLLEKVAGRVVENHKSMKSFLDVRDPIELIASAIVAVVMAYFAWSTDNFYVSFGSSIVVLACIENSAVLLWARRGANISPDRLSVRDFTIHQRTVVRRQLLLARHVAWWYLLPSAVGLLIMTYGFGDLLFAIVFWTLMVLLYGWIWKMSQRAVTHHLQPLEQAYTLTLESLDRPEEDFLSRSYEALAPPQCKRQYSRGTIIALFVFFLALALVGLVIVKLMDARGVMDSGQSYPKLSPFAAVRWQDDRPEVQVEGQWYELLKIDNLSVDEIVGFCYFRYHGLARKRFEEDLVEVLTRMGHPPGERSTLTVKELPDGSTVVLEAVEWTRENRNAIKRRNNDRADDRQTSRSVSRYDPHFVRAADESISGAYRNLGFSGAVIIAQDDEILYSKAVGHSGLELQKPNSLDTPFRIASLSKQFTAAAVLRLQQQGLLNVSDPVARYLPQFATSPYDQIQIHHLLSHTSGLPRIPDGLHRITWTFLSRRAATTTEYVNLAVKMPLQSAPGTEYQYSNFGYRILSAVIETISDRSFADYTEETIFRPLNMQQSGVARFPAPASEQTVADGLDLEQATSD